MYFFKNFNLLPALVGCTSTESTDVVVFIQWTQDFLVYWQKPSARCLLVFMQSQSERNFLLLSFQQYSSSRHLTSSFVNLPMLKLNSVKPLIYHHQVNWEVDWHWKKVLWQDCQIYDKDIQKLGVKYKVTCYERSDEIKGFILSEPQRNTCERKSQGP